MGFFSNLFDGITGQAAEDAAEVAAGARRKGAGEIGGLVTDFFRPEAEQSTAARRQLADFLGIAGPEAQRTAFGEFQNDPGFQASLDAGFRGIEQSNSARGLLDSGGAAKDLFKFGQQQQFGQFQDRLNRLASFNPNATGNLLTATGAKNNLNIGAADATAGGIIGRSNAATGFVNQLAQLGARAAGGFGGSGFSFGAGAGSGSGFGFK